MSPLENLVVWAMSAVLIALAVLGVRTIIRILARAQSYRDR